jgi:ACR3 family arsenite efflux pump ArsB
MFKNLTKNKVDETPAQEATLKVSGQADILEKVLPLIYKIIILIGLLIGVYMCSGFLGSYTHTVALSVFVMGVFYYLLND